MASRLSIRFRRNTQTSLSFNWDDRGIRLVQDVLMNTAGPVQSEAYRAALSWLYDRIDYERTRPIGHNPFRLERIERLLHRIGSPHLKIPAVHIAGTKGKGSTAAMIDSVLRHAGIRTGLFTSPHIEQFEERMRVNGNIPAPERIADLVTRLRDVLRSADAEEDDRIPTFFEVTTLMAWMLFAEEQVEIAVLETGLGGRLDCTNVCRPLVTVITSIGLDHTHILGDTLEKIAAEKAGIIKAGVPVVQGQLPGEADAEVRATAERRGCRRYVCGRDFAWVDETPTAAQTARRRTQDVQIITPTQTLDRVSVPLLGRHQAHNASLAAMACELLQQSGWSRITQDSLIQGIGATQWPLRFEVLEGHPTLVLDAAHNPDSMRAVAQVLKDSEWKNRRRILVFAVSSDKDAVSMLRLILPHFDAVVLTRFLSNPRSVPVDQLTSLATPLRPDNGSNADFLHTADGPAPAIELARSLAGSDGVVVITGSIFLAAEARTLLMQQSRSS